MGRPLALIAILLASTAQAGTLTGRVHDEDTGEPVGGVTILIEADGDLVQAAITDEDGEWAIAVPGGARYDVTYEYLDTELTYPRVWVGRTATHYLEQLIGPAHYSPGSCEVLLPIPTALPIVVGDGSWDAITAALARGERPPAATVRIEELVNHVAYSLPAPSAPETLAITTEVGPTPWNDATKLLRVVLHTSVAAHAVQLEFEENPDRVESYRLLGYENAGTGRLSPGVDLSAGFAVTALYEIRSVAGVGPLRHLAMLKARFTSPEGQPRVLNHVVSDREVLVRDTTIDFHFAAALAGFGMLLANTPDRADLDWNTVALLAKRGIGTDATGERRPFLAIIQQARWVAP